MKMSLAHDDLAVDSDEVPQGIAAEVVRRTGRPALGSPSGGRTILKFRRSLFGCIISTSAQVLSKVVYIGIVSRPIWPSISVSTSHLRVSRTRCFAFSLFIIQSIFIYYLINF